MNGRVLIIAGSDSSGGAGIQADIKTVTALGGYASTAITALTVQNTLGVSDIHDVPPDFVFDQMKAVLTDIGADCIKIGMLHRTDIIDAVCKGLDAHGGGIPVVVDPVMVAKGGASLLTDDATQAMKEKLIPRATILTPNIPEAEALSGLSAATIADAQAAARTLNAAAVLLKGGHRDGDEVTDLLLDTEGNIEIFTSPRVDTANTHGTGCTLASAIATGIAQGIALRPSVIRARAYVLEAIRTAPGYGAGHGPLNHGHTMRES